LVLLILESLGSTELLFILVMALVFFGPRKLPQLSRSLGKNLAEFRKASEDFKQTWEKEVNLEEAVSPPVGNHTLLPTESSLQPPTIEAITPDRVIAREAAGAVEVAPHNQTELVTSPGEDMLPETQPAAKHDWL
jgi:Tat protein translocase TatB subunit